MKYRTLNITVFLSLLLLGGLYSCLDEIELDVPKGLDSAIIVQGSLFKGDPTIVKISINRLFDFTSAGRQQINVRSVVLRDDQGAEIEIPQLGEIGYYEAAISKAQFAVVENRSYQIEVNTFDGRTIMSSFEKIPEGPKIEKLSSSIVKKEIPDGRGGLVNEDFVRFGVHTPLQTSESGDKSYLRWQMERTYQLTDGSIFSSADPKTCYITQQTDVSNLAILDPYTLTSDRIDDFAVFDELINFRFAEGYYLTVYQQPITEGAFTYWNQISNIIERNGNMFEPPAGQLVSNLENINDPNDLVFGYFYATQSDTMRIYISPAAVGSPARRCPPPPEVEQNSETPCPVLVCCECLTEGTAVKPEFWIK